MLVHHPNTPERQRDALDVIHARAQSWRDSFEGRDYVKRRKAALKGRE
jgi:hypothetical protein